MNHMKQINPEKPLVGRKGTAACMALLLSVLLCTPFLAVRAAVDTGESGSKPIAENLELSTYRGVSVGGILKAVDPDGEELTFEITTPPGKGSLELEDEGRFVYTPKEGKRGKDYFGYQAIDASGNRSQEATVIIRLVKQKTDVNYTDMKDSAGECAAVTLAENGLFRGENLAGNDVFSPDKEVSRSEFLALCMALTGTDPLSDVTSTGFADDADIEVWAKPYVSTALLSGLVHGYPGESSSAVFAPDQTITLGEAAVLLDRALDLTDSYAVWFMEGDDTPAWARQSLTDLSVCSLLPYGAAVSDCDRPLTRVQAAEMLSGAVDVLNRR